MSDAQPISGLRPGEVAEHVFLCGDPARVDKLSSAFADARTVCDVREYRVVTGVLGGVPVSAASTGIGAPGTAILLEELAKLGAHTFLRVGNSGGLAPDLAVGDLVITTGAVRDDGTSTSYVVPEYPAIANHRIVAALEDAAGELGIAATSGVTWSLDAFYARNATLEPGHALGSMSFGGYWTEAQGQRIRAMQAAGVKNCEMESGVLLTLAGLFGLRAGCICVVSDRTPWPGPSEIDLDRNMANCIEVAQCAMSRLAADGKDR